MNVQVDLTRVRNTSWHAYAVRFVFGGLVTAFAGFVTKTYGPVVGGLFLGFPAIFPASLTLVKKHEGERAAGDDALGAVAGSVGLVAFAAVVWGLAVNLAAWLTLLCAAIAWLGLSILAWRLLRRFA